VARWSLTTPHACIAAWTVVGPTNRNPSRRRSFESAVDSGVVVCHSEGARGAGRGGAPEELVQGRAGVAELDSRAGVCDRRFDLAAVADDPRVLEQARDVAFPEARHDVGVEAGEHGAEALPLPEDREPRQAGLEALEAEAFVDAVLVRHRPSPLVVVVGPVERVGRRPAALRLHDAQSRTDRWSERHRTGTARAMRSDRAASRLDLGRGAGRDPRLDAGAACGRRSRC
jgi:hypothetical protein